MTKKPAFSQTRTRYCVKFDEDALSFLRRTANLQEDESVIMLIDDSMRARRTKNVIFTDRRILWQEKRGAPYKELLLESLNGSSVFATSYGLATIITILNEDVRVSFRFNNIRSCDALLIIFHNYLSRQCAGYVPFGTENEARYKEEILAPHNRKRIVVTVFAIAGSLALVLCAFADSLEFFDYIMQRRMLVSAIVFWSANISFPASKSKLSKALLQYFFVLYALLLSIYMTVSLFDKIICLSCAVTFLKLDLVGVESDASMKAVPIIIVTISLLGAIMMML